MAKASNPLVDRLVNTRIAATKRFNELERSLVDSDAPKPVDIRIYANTLWLHIAELDDLIYYASRNWKRTSRIRTGKTKAMEAVTEYLIRQQYPMSPDSLKGHWELTKRLPYFRAM